MSGGEGREGGMRSGWGGWKRCPDLLENGPSLGLNSMCWVWKEWRDDRDGKEVRK